MVVTQYRQKQTAIVLIFTNRIYRMKIWNNHAGS